MLWRRAHGVGIDAIAAATYKAIGAAAVGHAGETRLALARLASAIATRRDIASLATTGPARRQWVAGAIFCAGAAMLAIFAIAHAIAADPYGATTTIALQTWLTSAILGAGEAVFVLVWRADGVATLGHSAGIAHADFAKGAFAILLARAAVFACVCSTCAVATHGFLLANSGVAEEVFFALAIFGARRAVFTANFFADAVAAATNTRFIFAVADPHARDQGATVEADAAIFVF